MMTPDQRLMTVGAYVHGGLYLASCVAVGYLTQHPVALYAGITGFGMSFLCFAAQAVGGNRTLAATCSVLSLICGITAGIALLPIW